MCTYFHVCMFPCVHVSMRACFWLFRLNFFFIYSWVALLCSQRKLSLSFIIYSRLLPEAASCSGRNEVRSCTRNNICTLLPNTSTHTLSCVCVLTLTYASFLSLTLSRTFMYSVTRSSSKMSHPKLKRSGILLLLPPGSGKVCHTLW